MYRMLFIFLCCFIPSISFGDDLTARAQQVFDATRIVCSGISDEISKVSNISKINTAVTGVGTVAAGGALVAGVKKSQEEEEIDKLVAQICEAGGCTAEGVENMSNEDFFNNIIQPMAEIAELQKRLEKSKKLGNWRTGLMAGTIGTNVASAIISGVNRDQSELIQHIQACDAAIQSANDMSKQLKSEGITPMENPIVKKLSDVDTWCKSIDINDIEKIEKRMTGVMGTSIAGTAIGIVGVGTSAAANSDKYMDHKLTLSEADKKKEHALNTTANVMAGANTVAGAVETGLNISLITLTKRLMEQATRCEEVLK